VSPFIQTPQPVEKLARQYRIRNPDGLFLEDALVPVVLVDDLSGAAVIDRGYPRDCIGRINLGAPGAGNVQQFVWQPVNRGITSQLNAILFDPVGGTQPFEVEIVRAGTALAITTSSNLTKTFVDCRLTNRELPSVQIGSNVVVVGTNDGVPVFRARLGADAIFPFSFKGVDGGGVLVVQQTANLSAGVTFFWTEYLASEE